MRYGNPLSRACACACACAYACALSTATALPLSLSLSFSPPSALTWASAAVAESVGSWSEDVAVIVVALDGRGAETPLLARRPDDSARCARASRDAARRPNWSGVRVTKHDHG